MTGGTLTFLAPPDYESPADHDSDNVYQVTLNANTRDEAPCNLTLNTHDMGISFD